MRAIVTDPSAGVGGVSVGLTMTTAITFTDSIPTVRTTVCTICHYNNCFASQVSVASVAGKQVQLRLVPSSSSSELSLGLPPSRVSALIQL
jgi:hypothetical protein